MLHATFQGSLHVALLPTFSQSRRGERPSSAAFSNGSPSLPFQWGCANATSRILLRQRPGSLKRPLLLIAGRPMLMAAPANCSPPLARQQAVGCLPEQATNTLPSASSASSGRTALCDWCRRQMCHRDGSPVECCKQHFASPRSPRRDHRPYQTFGIGGEVALSSCLVSTKLTRFPQDLQYMCG